MVNLIIYTECVNFVIKLKKRPNLGHKKQKLFKKG